MLHNVASLVSAIIVESPLVKSDSWEAHWVARPRRNRDWLRCNKENVSPQINAHEGEQVPVGPAEAAQLASSSKTVHCCEKKKHVHCTPQKCSLFIFYETFGSGVAILEV